MLHLWLSMTTTQITRDKELVLANSRVGIGRPRLEQNGAGQSKIGAPETRIIYPFEAFVLTPRDSDLIIRHLDPRFPLHPKLDIDNGQLKRQVVSQKKLHYSNWEDI